ncbi:hypothetical protein K438DRAFT_2064522 [Mycena galopus ATCC 62051]|nr:hypothetical protein K438DRAFT_2064522 [Mycena galopus ATCC 62051]
MAAPPSLPTRGNPKPLPNLAISTDTPWMNRSLRPTNGCLGIITRSPTGVPWTTTLSEILYVEHYPDRFETAFSNAVPFLEEYLANFTDPPLEVWRFFYTAHKVALKLSVADTLSLNEDDDPDLSVFQCLNPPMEIHFILVLTSSLLEKASTYYVPTNYLLPRVLLRPADNEDLASSPELEPDKIGPPIGVPKRNASSPSSSAPAGKRPRLQEPATHSPSQPSPPKPTTSTSSAACPAINMPTIGRTASKSPPCQPPAVPSTVKVEPGVKSTPSVRPRSANRGAAPPRPSAKDHSLPVLDTAPSARQELLNQAGCLPHSTWRPGIPESLQVAVEQVPSSFICDVLLPTMYANNPFIRLPCVNRGLSATCNSPGFSKPCSNCANGKTRCTISLDIDTFPTVFKDLCPFVSLRPAVCFPNEAFQS